MVNYRLTLEFHLSLASGHPYRISKLFGCNSASSPSESEAEKMSSFPTSHIFLTNLLKLIYHSYLSRPSEMLVVSYGKLLQFKNLISAYFKLIEIKHDDRIRFDF